MLRAYQVEALEAIKRHYKTVSKRCLLRLPTGAGKTTVFCEFMQEFKAQGMPSLMVVRGRKLVSQASERLTREDVKHSVLMAGDKGYDPHALITVASIDTLFARKIAPMATLIVIDEVHASLSEAFTWLYAQYPDAYFLGVTATPFNPIGFRAIADAIIEPIKVDELIAQKFLVPGKYYVPEKVDLSHVKKAKGEYVLKDLGAAMNQARLFGPIVDTYKRLGEGRPALLFAVNILHSKRLAAAFNDAGIAAEHIDAYTSGQAREEAQARLESGAIRVICSVGVLCVGVDIPSVAVIIMARPTLSYNLAMQMAGRASRPFPGKDRFIYLDHAGNIERHGFYETYRIATLDGKPPAFRVVVSTCEKCFCTWQPNSDPRCPGKDIFGERCGHVNEVKPVPVKPLKVDESVELREVDMLTFEEREREDFIKRIARESAERGHKPGAAFFKIKQRYGPQVAGGSWKKIHAAYKVEA